MLVDAKTLAGSEKETLFNNQTLGILGMIGAPMLLIESLLRINNILPQDHDNAWIGLVEMIYIGGWIALAIGMRRMRVTGDSKASRALFIIQMIGLTAAFLFTVQVLFGASYQDENVGLFFKICDIGFPFSHLLMLVVGIFVWRAGIWRGWLRFASFSVGIFLALLMSGLGAFINLPSGATLFSVSTAVGLFSLAYGVFRDGKSERAIRVMKQAKYLPLSLIYKMSKEKTCASE